MGNAFAFAHPTSIRTGRRVGTGNTVPTTSIDKEIHYEKHIEADSLQEGFINFRGGLRCPDALVAT